MNVIYLAGVNCVGKTTVGSLLAKLLHFDFRDLDYAAQAYYDMKIAEIGKKFSKPYDYRAAMARVLENLLQQQFHSTVISLTPIGLFSPIWSVVQNTERSVVVALEDTAENIAKRMVWFDDENNLMERTLTGSQVLRLVKETQEYVGVSLRRAHVRIDISGMDAEGAAAQVKGVLDAAYPLRTKHP
jgi:shikimate kinase